MESYSSQLLCVVWIFITSIKNLHRNKPLILSITFFTVSLGTLVNFANFFSFQPLITDLFTNLFLITSLDTSFLKSILTNEKDSSLLLGLQLIFKLALYVISWVSTVAIVYVSAMSHLRKNLTLQELVLRTKTIWKRCLITSFYVSLLNVSYNFLIEPLVLLAFLQTHGAKLSLVIGIFVVLLACLFFVYVTVVCTLGLVASVLEDVCGFQALGKAEKLISGRKVQGIVVSLLFVIIVLSVPYIVALITPQKQKTTGFVALLIMVVQTIICGLVRMLSSMVYTVFYFECKKSHGEEVEVESEMDYNMVSAIPLVDPVLP